MACIRLAVDVGGTFTDVALEDGAQRYTAKVLTSADSPERSVVAGVQAVLESSSLRAVDVSIIIHGTTLATNALIERKGARTAFVTSSGFRDVLEMRNESRYEQYDLGLTLPEPLVPRHLRFPIAGRLDNTGLELEPLDEDALKSLASELVGLGVESVAVGFLHAYVEPDHELRAREILAAAMPAMPISLSAEVSPEMREWERFSTTVANAYVQPLMMRYLDQLAVELDRMRVGAPLFLMLSGGGLTTIETAARFPIRLVESGPAGGAIFAADIARRARTPRALSFDMGGTTAKACLVDAYQPHVTRGFEVARIGRFKRGSGLPVRVPVIDMVEIGAGGGSIASVDDLGRISVGPESAGADPGPASYGRGGSEPTVTDANLVLGRYDAAGFAGGRFPLDLSAAKQALSADVASRLHATPAVAAAGVVELVDENMANAARSHAIEAGAEHEGRVLIAFGGGGPVHAHRVADKLGLNRVLVPPDAGVGSAIGLLRAPIAYEIVRSLYQRLGKLDLHAVNVMLDEMVGEADAIVKAGSFGCERTTRRLAYMRYVGQGHEIAVELPVGPLKAADATSIRERYMSEYTTAYARPVPSAEIEILSFAVSVSCHSSGLPVPAEQSVIPCTPVRRPVRDSVTAEISDWLVRTRRSLAIGEEITGPAILVDDETSTVVGVGWTARRDRYGMLELVRVQN